MDPRPLIHRQRRWRHGEGLDLATDDTVEAGTLRTRIDSLGWLQAFAGAGGPVAWWATTGTLSRGRGRSSRDGN